jgi:outer membrane protein assembly factor BamB
MNEHIQKGEYHMRRSVILILGLIFILLFSLNLHANDWPHYRGPYNNGTSDEKGWNPQALNSGSHILWETNIGQGHSSISVKGDYLYTMGENRIISNQDTLNEEIVYCFNAKTGSEIWQYAYPCRHLRWPGPAATPTIDGSYLFTLGRNGNLFCFDAKSGAVIWKRNLATENLAQTPNWGFCGSPTVEGDLLLVNGGKSGIAFDKKTGKTVWASDPQRGWLSTPLVYDFNGKRLAAIISTRNMYGVDVKTGNIDWNIPFQSDADPTLIGSKMYLISGGRNNGSRLIDLQNGNHEVWANNNTSHAFPFPVIIDGYAYEFGNDRRSQPFQCVDIQTGEIQWRENLGDWGAVIAVDKKLIVIDGDGDLYIAKANPEKFDVISQAKVIQLRHWQSYPDGEPNTCWTSPAFANGKIYIRSTGGELVCVDVSK